jgi:hypothetical protein
MTVTAEYQPVTLRSIIALRLDLPPLRFERDSS